jgi:hypothetical protein
MGMFECTIYDYKGQNLNFYNNSHCLHMSNHFYLLFGLYVLVQ